MKVSGTELEEKGVHIVSTNNLPGYEVDKVLGFVWASSVRAKSVLEDLRALSRALWGGRINEYEELLNEGRHAALLNLNSNAKHLGANAVIGVKMFSAQVIPGTVEIMVYGTAVRVTPAPKA